MIKIQEQNIMKLTIDGQWDDDPDGDKAQAESYAQKYGYQFEVHAVKDGKFQLVGSKVTL